MHHQIRIDCRGAIYSVLSRTRAGPDLDLSKASTDQDTMINSANVRFDPYPCDMPFVTPALLDRLINSPAPNIFAASEGKAGFPFLLARDALPIVEK